MKIIREWRENGVEQTQALEYLNQHKKMGHQAIREALLGRAKTQLHATCWELFQLKFFSLFSTNNALVQKIQQLAGKKLLKHLDKEESALHYLQCHPIKELLAQAYWMTKNHNLKKQILAKEPNIEGIAFYTFKAGLLFNDVTTTPDAPPNPEKKLPKEFNKRFYPFLKPLIVPGKTQDELFIDALDVSEQMANWKVIKGVGQIHAVATTKLGFKDDIWIEVRDNVIHVRSSSRVGIGDFGVNAKRIETFIKTIRRRYTV